MTLLERFRAAHRALPPAASLGFRWGPLSRQRRTSVGVDFGGGAIKLAQVRWTRQGPRLENYAFLPSPPQLMEEGAVRRPDDAGELLQAAVQGMGLGQRTVGTSVGGPGVLMRHISLPRVTLEEMRAAMKFEAPQHLPIPEEHLLYDFTPVPEAAVPEHQTAVFLAGTHRQLVGGHLAALARAGLRPVAIEPDCMATLRALEWMGLVPRQSSLPVVLLDVGESDSRIAVMRYGVPMLARTVPHGLTHLRAALVDARVALPDEADMVLRMQGVCPAPDTSAAVEPWLSGLLDAVGRSVEFFLIQHRGVALERLYLVGGGALLPGLVEALTQHLSEVLEGRPESVNLKVQVAGLSGIEIHPDLLPAVEQFGPMLLQALGSALREGSPA